MHTSWLQVVQAALKDADCSVDDVDWLLLHQANQRILDSASQRLKVIPFRFPYRNDRMCHNNRTILGSVSQCDPFRVPFQNNWMYQAEEVLATSSGGTSGSGLPTKDDMRADVAYGVTRLHYVIIIT